MFRPLYRRLTGTSPAFFLGIRKFASMHGSISIHTTFTFGFAAFLQYGITRTYGAMMLLINSTETCNTVNDHLSYLFVTPGWRQSF